MVDPVSSLANDILPGLHADVLLVEPNRKAPSYDNEPSSKESENNVKEDDLVQKDESPAIDKEEKGELDSKSLSDLINQSQLYKENQVDDNLAVDDVTEVKEETPAEEDTKDSNEIVDSKQDPKESGYQGKEKETDEQVPPAISDNGSSNDTLEEVLKSDFDLDTVHVVHNEVTGKSETDLQGQNREVRFVKLDRNDLVAASANETEDANDYWNATVSDIDVSDTDSGPTLFDGGPIAKQDLATSSEKYNEITAVHEARAKRNVDFVVKGLGNFVTQVIRKIRNVDDSEDIARTNRAEDGIKVTESYQYTPVVPQEIPFPMLVTLNEGNYTLDARFRSPSQYHSSLGGNNSLEVPVSKYFGDNTVQLVFPEPVFQCQMPALSLVAERLCVLSQSPDATDDSPDYVVSTSSPDTEFSVDVGTYKAVAYRFRYPLNPGRSGDVSLDVSGQDYCHMSKSKLGSVFGELNLHFYRVCHEWYLEESMDINMTLI